MTLALKMADIRYDAFDEGYEEGREQGFQFGREQGLEQGLEQGRIRGAYEKALETAKNLLAEGIDPQLVARCTNLPLDTVQNLIQSP